VGPVSCRTASVALAALALTVLTACGSDTETSPAGASRSTTPASPSAGLPAAGTGLPGLPGDEAVTPPPPDPDSGNYRALLARMPAGTLTGDVELTVSGLVGFAEPAAGRCLTTGSRPALEIDLSDGSVLRIEATGAGLTSSLQAPGVEARHTLTDVELTGGSPAVLAGDLLTDGTSEPAGALRLEFTCA
jgi:hypothetical protein